MKLRSGLKTIGVIAQCNKFYHTSFALTLIAFNFFLWPDLYVPRTATAMAETATSYRATPARLVFWTGERAIPGFSKVAVEKQASNLVL